LCIRTESRSLEICIEARDDIVFLGSNNSAALLPVQRKDGLVQLCPELSASVGDDVDGFAHLANDGYDTTVKQVTRGADSRTRRLSLLRVLRGSKPKREEREKLEIAFPSFNQECCDSIRLLV
jgi:hypothetical protein